MSHIFSVEGGNGPLCLKHIGKTDIAKIVRHGICNVAAKINRGMNFFMLRASAAQANCLHCGKETPLGATFCCAGCASINALLVKKGLEHFYELRDVSNPKNPRSFSPPVSDPDEDASEEIPALALQQRFYLEGIHCIGCLWLLEKLPDIDARIEFASLDFTHGILSITRTSAITWPEVTALIRQLGYLPRPLAGDEGESARRADHIRQSIRLGIAAFCSGNIMLLTVSLYAGADGAIGRNFQLLSFLLAIPALTYSAWPLYRSAIAPLRHGKISVDLAVSLALWVGSGLSVYNLIFGRASETYFDSLTMLVFLLLASRYFLNRFRESMAKETPCLSLLARHRFFRMGIPSGDVSADELKAEDKVLLRAGQTLPADSTLISPFAHFDFSLLTGESEPVKLLQGDSADAGARLLSSEAAFLLQREAAVSRLAKIVEQIRSQQLSRSPSLDIADRIGRRFVFVVLVLATLTALYLPFPDGLQRALVLVIVTCPCVLAFAVPLAFTRALQQAARAGILFRSAEKLEELASAKTIYLDKTGTLTEGNFEVLEWEPLFGEAQPCRAAALALELQSAHPVAKAIVRYLGSGSMPVPEVQNFREVPGSGVSGIIDQESWEITRIEGQNSPHNLVGIFRGGVLAASVSLGDKLRPEAASFVAKIRGLGLRPVILSGDSERRVAAVAHELGITEWRSALSPEKKAGIVRGSENSLMLGDGANDSIAFQAANVGIAMRGSMELSLKSADIVLASPGLEGVLRALRASRRTMNLVRGSFAVSLAYNLFAGALALSGNMSPLLAAALMPVSALSVFSLIQWKTREELR